MFRGFVLVCGEISVEGRLIPSSGVGSSCERSETASQASETIRTFSVCYSKRSEFPLAIFSPTVSPFTLSLISQGNSFHNDFRESSLNTNLSLLSGHAAFNVFNPIEMYRIFNDKPLAHLMRQKALRRIERQRFDRSRMIMRKCLIGQTFDFLRRDF